MEAISYDNKYFRARIAEDSDGDVNADTLFHYREVDSIVWATYSGGQIDWGTLIAKKQHDGSLEMRYMHYTVGGDFKTGVCTTRPTLDPDGRLVLNESWTWLEGDVGSGTSTLEEVYDN